MLGLLLLRDNINQKILVKSLKNNILRAYKSKITKLKQKHRIINNKQKERDILKNISKYNIPLIRLTTNGSREENIIRSKLDEIVSNK